MRVTIGRVTPQVVFPRNTLFCREESALDNGKTLQNWRFFCVHVPY